MSTELSDPIKLKKARIIIIAASIAIPLVVAVLFRVKIEGVDLSILPPIYAGINGLTAVLLVGARMAIKKGNRERHRKLIRSSLLLSILFLGAYVAYHMTSDPTSYGGSIAYAYYFILVSHILLSVIIVPLVLFTYLFAWQGNFTRHKKWAKVTWPLWVYVAVSGVVVYLMISPYYV